MSYDTVALVAREPDLETVIRVLEHIAPELWLHPHTDSALFELRDGQGSLLAAVEPGLALASRQEIGRLLGPGQQDAAPDPCWWVETRARPDVAGRRIADDFAQTLASRLGGTVWTSGQADTDFWAQGPHPAADQVTDHAVLVTQDRPVVPWSSWLADVVVRCGRERVLQLRTPVSSRLTLSAWTAVTASAGMWVVRDGNGDHFEGVTGLPLSWEEDRGFVRHMPGPPEKRTSRTTDDVPQGPVPRFLDPPPTGTHLEIRLSTLHPHDEEPRLGRGAEILAECLSGPPPVAWGLHEPATQAWDPALILASTRQHAPGRLLLHFAGPWELGHPYVGRIGLTWANGALSEEVTMLMGLDQGGERTLFALTEAVQALGEADVLDTLWARRYVGRSDTTHEPTWRGLGSALGFAIGPRRVRQVGLPATENGPLPGTPFGKPERRSVWYPALGDVDDPRRALKALRAQWEHLASHAGKQSPGHTRDER